VVAAAPAGAAVPAPAPVVDAPLGPLLVDTPPLVALRLQGLFVAVEPRMDR
jgi:hypothetical protein